MYGHPKIVLIGERWNSIARYRIWDICPKFQNSDLQ
jgi:hypothetical protein